MELFDAETLKDLKFRAKKQLRQRLRGVRAAHPAAVLAQASERIVTRVLESPQFSKARSVALFWPLSDRQEVDVRPLADAALAADKRLYFPFLSPDSVLGTTTTGFQRVDRVSDLADRGQRFLEPPPESPRAERSDIDLVIVPALAVSATGHRLGYGRGFYDATLPDFCPPGIALAVAFDFQLLGELPVTDDDVACQLVVTDRRVLDLT